MQRPIHERAAAPPPPRPAERRRVLTPRLHVVRQPLVDQPHAAPRPRARPQRRHPDWLGRGASSLRARRSRREGPPSAASRVCPAPVGELGAHAAADAGVIRYRNVVHASRSPFGPGSPHVASFVEGCWSPVFAHVNAGVTVTCQSRQHCVTSWEDLSLSSGASDRIQDCSTTASLLRVQTTKRRPIGRPRWDFALSSRWLGRGHLNEGGVVMARVGAPERGGAREKLQVCHGLQRHGLPRRRTVTHPFRMRK